MPLATRNGKRAVAILACVGVSFVQCASDGGGASTGREDPGVVGRLVRDAAPVARIGSTFRLGTDVARSTTRDAWVSPPSPHADVPRGATETMLLTTTDGSRVVGVTREVPGLEGATARLDGGVVRFDGDGARARIFAHASEIEEIVDLERPTPLTYRLDLPRGLRAVQRAVGSTSFVEIQDERGEPRLRMRADRAWDARGNVRAVTLSLEGTSVRVAIDPRERDVTYPVAIDPSWFTAATPIRIRSGHSATLLGNGLILFAGGDTAANSSELYDTRFGGFTPESSLTEPRAYHTATLLLSGRVLLCGGMTPGTQVKLSTCEIYDPHRRSFEPTASMSVARAVHSAVRLPSGRVMIVGGANETSTELYDETTGTFSQLTARDATGAGNGPLVVLPSGKVFFSAGNYTAQFDPKANSGAGSWTGVNVPPRGSATERTAVLLRSGLVLVMSGKACGTAGDPVNCGSYGDLFDPAGGPQGLGAATTSTPDLQGAGNTLTLLPTGEALMTGGGVPTNAASVYDPVSGNVTVDAPMANAHAGHTATVLPNGDVIVLGGDQAGVELRPATGRITATTGNMVVGRTQHSAVRLRNGKVLLVGGQNFGTPLDSAELFDPVAGTFAATGSMHTPRVHARMDLLPSGDVLVTGGSDPTVFTGSEIYVVASGTFRTIAAMGTPRSNHAAAVLPDGKLLFTGGAANGATLSTTEVFDPKTETFVPGENLVVAHQGHGMVRLPNGHILLVGDGDAELYDPVSQSFAPTGRPGASRDGRTAHLLPSRQVFVAGGTTLAGELYNEKGGFWSFTSPLPFTHLNVVWTGTAEGRMVSSGGQLFEGVVAQGMLFDPLAVGGAGETVYTSTGRTNQTATLLTTGGVLITGGDPCYGNCVGAPLTSAAIYSEGATSAARPTIDQAPSNVSGGETITIQGHGFANAGEGSSGTSSASALNAPQVMWVSESDGASIPGEVRDFTDTQITWRAPPTALAGAGYLHVSVGGVMAKAVPFAITTAKQATPCEFDAECGSGFCSDNFCCDQRCNGKCEACSGARKLSGADGVCGAVPPGRDIKGLCFALQGQACADPTQCATGFCVSGVCCDSTCAGTCLSCTQPGHVGSCSAISEGACDVACDGDHVLKKVGSPDVDCAPYKCDGKTCRANCASARDCVEPSVCSFEGLCVPPLEASASDASVWGCSTDPRGTSASSGSLVGLGLLAALGAFGASRRRRRR